MRTLPLVAGAVLALASSAVADPFVLSHCGLRPRHEGSITASSGAFVTQFPEPDLENAYLNQYNIAVTPDAVVWRQELDFVMTSTWLAVDPFGPKGRLGTDPYGRGWATYVSGPAGTTHAPTFTFSLSGHDAGLAVNGTLGDPVNGDGLAAGFVGGLAGIAWGPSERDGFQAHSLLSNVNGRQVDSLFVGHFVMSDPNARLVALPLIVGFSGRSPGAEATTVNFVPIDGTPGRQLTDTSPITLGDEIPYHIESERTTFTNSLGNFTAIDLYLVSTGPYPVTVTPPPGVGNDGDDGDDSDGGDDDTPPPDDTLPGLPPPTPAPTPAPPPKPSFDVSDIAMLVRVGDTTPEALVEMLQGAGFDPLRYSAKDWKKLMTGLYDHRIAPSLLPEPTKQERKDAIATLIATYGIAPDLADLTDTGTQDANGDGMVDFADVARILEVGGAEPERLVDTLALVGMDPLEMPNRKAWKSTVKAFYSARILPGFAGLRDRKQQKRDAKILVSLR